MTNKEAIKELKTLREDYWNEYEVPMLAIDMAIKALEQQSEDAISRAEVQTAIEMSASRYTLAREHEGMGQVEWSDQLIKVSDAVDIIRNLSSVKPLEQESQTFEWCTDCREYDQDKHCCPRYNKVIRNAVKEIHYNCTDEEIAKSFIEDVEAVKDLLPMAESEE